MPCKHVAYFKPYNLCRSHGVSCVTQDDSIKNGTTVVYATHIFGGLDEFGTHIAFLGEGTVKSFSTFEECKDLQVRHTVAAFACTLAGAQLPDQAPPHSHTPLTPIIAQANIAKGVGSPLLRTVEGWLRAEKDAMIAGGRWQLESAAKVEDGTLTVGLEEDVKLASETKAGQRAAVPSGFASGRFYNYYD